VHTQITEKYQVILYIIIALACKCCKGAAEQQGETLNVEETGQALEQLI